MTYVALALIVALVISLLAIVRLEREHQDERRSLLDRIQHPEIHQVEPGERVEHEPPQDAAELAQVGLEVPEFVNVGGNDAAPH